MAQQKSKTTPKKAAAKTPVAKKAPAKTKSSSHKMQFAPRSVANKTHKPRRPFGDPVAPPKPDPTFVAIPAANKMPASLSYDLVRAIGQAGIDRIIKADKMVFHSVGDTGDINHTGITKDLSDQMESQFSDTDLDRHSFFYHFGEVVYYNGESTDYRDQFYDPYKNYPNVILAIPGNHDGQTIVNKNDPPDPEPSLKGYFANLCDKKQSKSQSSPYRYTMDEPWPYWVLNTPFATFIGLYSNVDGSLDKWNDNAHPQFSWLVEQLKNADKSKCLILAVHHSPYSLDDDHGGYPDILDAIDQAVAKSGGRYPDLVLSGHVHNYQRFQRKVDNRKVPHIIAGCGGYASLKTIHRLQLDPATKKRIQATPKKPFQTTVPDVQLMTYNEDLPGFLKITIDKSTITGEYYVNTTTNETQSTTPFDTFTFDYTKK